MPGWSGPWWPNPSSRSLSPLPYSVMLICQFFEHAKSFIAPGPLHMLCSCTSLLRLLAYSHSCLSGSFKELLICHIPKRPSLTTMSEVSCFFYLLKFLSPVFHFFLHTISNDFICHCLSFLPSLQYKVLDCREVVFVKFTIISPAPSTVSVFNKYMLGLPWWRSGWESACQCRGHGFEPWSGKIPHAAEQLGPWATTTEPASLEPVLCNRRGRDSERPAHRDEEWPPLAATRESPRTETKTQHSQKIKKIYIYVE